MSLQGRYTVVRKIADGGMAEVFLARQHGAQGFEKLVVLKRVRPAYWADPHFRNMLVDEAHIAMGLNHGNLVQVLDLGEAQGRYFLAMELVDGWSVEQLLARTRAANTTLPQELALSIAASVCRALAYAHGHTVAGKPLTIVHRDVSPHNILVSSQGEVKLTDFGIALAQIKREDTASNVVKGKIAFMSPEQANAEPLDARSDIFSLGVVLYAMAVGKRPFDGATDLETLLQVRACVFPPPMRPGLNPQISRIILRALRKAPAERYQKAEEMLLDIERVMRVAFPATGQTELKQWLADLARKDGALAVTADHAPGDDISQETVAADATPVTAPGSGSRQPEGARPPPPPPQVSRDAGESTASMLRAVRPKPPRRPWLVGGGFALAVLLGIGILKCATGAPPASPPAATVAAAPQPTADPEPSAAAVPAAEPAPAPAPSAAPPGASPPPATAAASASPSAGTETDAAEDDAGDIGDDGDEDAPAGEVRHKRVKVSLKSTPPRATVKTRTRTIGTTPINAWLRVDTPYTLTFSKPGFESVTRTVRPEEGRPGQLEVTLPRASRPPPAASPKAKEKKWYWPF